MAYTPGPYSVYVVRTLVCVEAGTFGIAEVLRNTDGPAKEDILCLDNAHLLAAAPDLLAACEELTSFIKLLGQTRRSSFLARSDLDDHNSTWSDHIEEGFQELYAKGVAAITRARGLEGNREDVGRS